MKLSGVAVKARKYSPFCASLEKYLPERLGFLTLAGYIVTAKLNISIIRHHAGANCLQERFYYNPKMKTITS